jgi:cytochrome c oxidase cbb3-type subunit 2
VHRVVRHSFAIPALLCLAFAAHDFGFSAERQRFPVKAAQPGLDSYLVYCSACHQASGEGLPGMFPPLKGSGVVNKDDAAKHIQLILDGIQGARAGGVVYAAAMPPFAGVLTDQVIAEITNYERSSWGNHGKPVTVTQVSVERSHSK